MRDSNLRGVAWGGGLDSRGETGHRGGPAGRRAEGGGPETFVCGKRSHKHWCQDMKPTVPEDCGCGFPNQSHSHIPEATGTTIRPPSLEPAWGLPPSSPARLTQVVGRAAQARAKAGVGRSRELPKAEASSFSAPPKPRPAKVGHRPRWPRRPEFRECPEAVGEGSPLGNLCSEL